MKNITFIVNVIFLFFLVACGSAKTPISIADTVTTTPTILSAPPPTSIIAPTLAPDPVPTSDTRLPPEQWQEWPVVPAVTSRSIEIYQTGMAMGNNPHAFSKVGDCQNIKDAFMGFFDLPDYYNLGTDYQYLQETIDNFSGYFNTDGQAVKGGFNAATVLSPLWANPDVCLPGENPLECELRTTKPSIVFISFEVWWDGRTPETYEKYMRQVIETVIDHGAVPILATKADNVEGDHDINLTTAHLAYEYNLPLWNFWLAVQPLPDHGMDMVRNDGFHISTDGWNTRSFTGLQALDSIWQGLRDSSSAGMVPPTSTPEPAPIFGLLPIPPGGPSLSATGDRVVFGISSRLRGKYEPKGIYLFDPVTLGVSQLFGPGYYLQSASPDGKYLLVNQGSALYRTDGSTLTLLTDQFFSLGSQGAFWLPDGRIVLILNQNGTNSIEIMDADSSALTPLDVGALPVDIYPSSDGSRFTWGSGSCDSAGLCSATGAWLTDLTSGQSQSLDGIQRPLISPDGLALASVYIPKENKSNLSFSYFDGYLPRQYPLMGDILEDFAWQPGGGWLAVNMAERSDYSGRVTGDYNFLIDPHTFSTRQLQSVNLLNPKIVWSPDGAGMLWFGTDWSDNAYIIRLWQVNVESGQSVEMTDALGLAGSDYLFVSNAVWLVRP